MTLTAAPHSGLDEIDARRHVARAAAWLVEDLDHRQDRQRVDAVDRPCRDHPTVARAAEAARGHQGTVIRHVTRIQRALRLDDLDEAGHLVLELGDAAARVGAALDRVDQALAGGCAHTCPDLPTADLERFAVELLDRLEAAGYRLSRGEGR